jgi:hypothetical protein
MGRRMGRNLSDFSNGIYRMDLIEANDQCGVITTAQMQRF